MIKKILIGIWAFIALCFIGVTALFVSIAMGWIGYLPDMSELENPNYKLLCAFSYSSLVKR